MDHLVAARKLITELVKSEQLEVRRAEIVIRELSQLVASLGRPPSGRELEDWLGDHAQVTELYAGPTVLDELIYRYLTPPPPAAGNVEDAVNPELVQQLRQHADDRDAHLVYADWLQERADPLGELIALGVTASAADRRDDDVVRFERHLKAHEARFLGGLAPKLPMSIALEWHYGLVRSIREQLEPLPPQAWTQLLRLRVCDVVGAIALRSSTPEYDAAIGEAAPGSLRALTLDRCNGLLPAQLLRRDLHSLSVAGSLAALALDTLPASLDRLDLRLEYIGVREVHHAPPQLDVRELHLSWTESMVTFLRNARLPRVEHLGIGLGVELGDARLAAVLGALELPAITQLTIRDGRLAPAVFDELARLPVTRRLSSLALTNLGLDDEAIRELVRTRAGFDPLAELDLSFNELSRDGLAAAAELATRVISQRQHKRGSAMELRVRRFAGSRLQAAESIAEPKSWRRAGVDGDIRWARYHGDAEYELFVTADLSRYGCSCPSSIVPCKHVVALALLAERQGLPTGSSDGIEGRVRSRTDRSEGDGRGRYGYSDDRYSDIDE